MKFLVFCFFCFLSFSFQVDAQPFVGDWEGKLSVQGMQLPIIFHVTHEEAYTATLDSPNQNAYGIPCGEVTVEGNQINIRVPSIGGGYKGELTGDDSVSGTWSQGGAHLPLNLGRVKGDPPAPTKKPQEPEPPYPYTSRDVEVNNVKVGVTLAATLTIPEGEGPFPGVVLVSGSGPQDRNETLLGHKPFLVLSDFLTRNGIAVLRYDDRGVGKSTGTFATASSFDFASDARAALQWLQDQQEVDPKRTGIIGHSEGGLIAPLVAVDYKETSFIVLMAGPGVEGEEILEQQTRLIALANGASEEDIKQMLKLNRGAFKIVTNEPDIDKASVLLDQYAEDYYASLSEEEKQEQGNSKDNLVASFNRVNTSWFRNFLTYDPAPTLARVTCPVLAINGEKDLQVPPEENLAAIRKALKKGKNPNYQVEELPGLNHLFQHAETGAPSEYASIDETMSEETMALIATWIKEH